MSLPAPNLDDRRFQDIVDEAKKLIPKYCPEWTNHNLSDPGIALVELFAWMTEMTLFRINQVPDRLYTKFLELVGIELFPASPAATDLTFWLSTTGTEPVIVPAGTQVDTIQSEVGDPVVFMTDQDLRVVKPELTAVLTGSASGRYLDCFADLLHPRAGVQCFTSDPLTEGDAFYLGFEGSLASNTVRLDIQAPVQGLGIDPDRPPLRWETWAGQTWVPARVYKDETGGLNRTGAITLLLPPVHTPLTLAEKRAWWLRARLIEPVGDEPPYHTSPEVMTLTAVSLGGTVSSHHAQPAPPEVLGQSTGEPGQVFKLRRAPVLPNRGRDEVRVNNGGLISTWNEVEDFSRSGPHDRHVIWHATSGEVRFGPSIRYPDGSTRQHGAVPPSGSVVEVSGYRWGGGVAGNVGPRSLTVLRTTIPLVDRVENLRPATGGVDPETVENAKLRGPAHLRTGNRAVTASDFELLTLEAAPSVARARCLPPARPGQPIRVLVIPRVDRAPENVELDDFVLSDELLNAITEHLDPRRILGTSIEVGTPYYQGATVAARVYGVPGRPSELVRQRALTALYTYVNPLSGGPKGGGWPFDTDLNTADLFELLEAVDGVERVEEVVLFEADLRNRQRYGSGKDLVRLRPESLFLSFQHRVVVDR